LSMLAACLIWMEPNWISSTPCLVADLHSIIRMPSRAADTVRRLALKKNRQDAKAQSILSSSTAKTPKRQAFYLAQTARRKDSKSSCCAKYAKASVNDT